MLSHSYGSYPVRMYHHYYRDKVAAVMLVDPTQYGMFANAIAKWQPDIDTYTGEIEQRRVAELSAWNDPTSNAEGIDNKASAALIQQANTFGDTPLVLIWSKDGIWQGGEAPADWHPQVWQRMKALYRQAVDDMHQLSTMQKTVFATTPQHNIFAYEPEIINHEFDLLLQGID